MRKQKAIVNFTSYKDLELGSVTTHIITGMTSNAYFPTPTVPIKTVQTALTSYLDALGKCGNGSKVDTDNKNTKRAELEELLSTLGTYVNTVAKCDKTKLDSTEFPLTKVPEAVGVLPAPSYIHASDGEGRGSINIEVSKVEKASGYIILYCESPADEDNAKWQPKLSSKTKCTISGLKSVTKYSFKGAAYSTESNKMDEYNFTDPVERVTQ
ncbi:MAG: hypothetical protein WCR55_09810 [Lentisphaerota bacterium]